MEIGFRWYGPSDSIPIKYINQIPGISSIVGSFFNTPAEEVIPENHIQNLKMHIEEYGFSFDCVESLPVHEDIKLGKSDRDKYIDVWCENLKQFAENGVSLVCYNFMLAVDWLRTDLSIRLADDSVSNAYNHSDVDKIDIFTGLPDWSQTYTPTQLPDVLKESSRITSEEFWHNLSYFLNAVVPVAEELGIKLALHPDDPPWDALGIIRPLGTADSLDRAVGLIESPSNGIAFCTGTLAARSDNDVYAMLKKLLERKKVNYVHFRNILITGEKEFHETAHNSDYGDLDMFRLVKILYENDYSGLIRVDHGRNIWDEERKSGYGLYDRALAVSYLTGLIEALQKSGFLNPEVH